MHMPRNSSVICVGIPRVSVVRDLYDTGGRYHELLPGIIYYSYKTFTGHEIPHIDYNPKYFNALMDDHNLFG